MSPVGLISGSIVIAALGLIIPAFAANGTLDGVRENTTSLNATGSDVPLLQKMSDQGLYLVQIAWPQLPLSPDGSFDLQIFFLNATQPTGTNGTIVQEETNFTGSGSEEGLTVPGTQANFADVKSYDIAIYSGDGRVLWQRADQPGSGASPGQHVILGNYTGPVIIQITDIRPGLNTTANGGTADSVKFSATVVPEFPYVQLGLAAAVSATLAAVRFSGALRKLRS